MLFEKYEKKHQKNCFLFANAKELIINLYNRFIEKQCSSRLVKVSYSTVRYILKSKNTEKKKINYKKYLRIWEELSVRIKQVIYKMYRENVIPTTATL